MALLAEDGLSCLFSCMYLQQNWQAASSKQTNLMALPLAVRSRPRASVRNFAFDSVCDLFCRKFERL
jgi:hypothetical protein